MNRHLPDPGYPYERLTPGHVAEIQRKRDKQMGELRTENEELRNELYYLKRKLQLLEETGLDINVIIDTHQTLGA